MYFKKTPQLNKKQNPIKKWVKDLNKHFPKKIYKSPIST